MADLLRGAAGVLRGVAAGGDAFLGAAEILGHLAGAVGGEGGVARDLGGGVDLLLDRGAWQGRQLVSPAWIDAMHADWVETGREAPMERYGLATWAGPGPDAWRLEGRYGQFVVIHRDAVVTITGHEEELEDRLSELAVEVTSA